MIRFAIQNGNLDSVTRLKNKKRLETKKIVTTAILYARENRFRVVVLERCLRVM